MKAYLTILLFALKNTPGIRRLILGPGSWLPCACFFADSRRGRATRRTHQLDARWRQHTLRHHRGGASCVQASGNHIFTHDCIFRSPPRVYLNSFFFIWRADVLHLCSPKCVAGHNVRTYVERRHEAWCMTTCVRLLHIVIGHVANNVTPVFSLFSCLLCSFPFPRAACRSCALATSSPRGIA